MKRSLAHHYRCAADAHCVDAAIDAIELECELARPPHLDALVDAITQRAVPARCACGEPTRECRGCRSGRGIFHDDRMAHEAAGAPDFRALARDRIEALR